MKRKQEIYVAPTIKVVEMKVRHTLLAGSTQTRGIQRMEEEDLGTY